MTRPDGRAADALRPVRITRGWLDHAEGSVLVEFGETRVLCAASVTEEVPRWRRGSGLGLGDRRVRDAAARDEHPQRPGVGQGPDRRAHPRDLPARRPVAARLRGLQGARREHDRRSTATCCRPTAAPGRPRSPAGTWRWRTRSTWLRERGQLKGSPLVASVSAVSVGIVAGEPRLDLCYEEDSAAETDMNVVCTGTGDFVEMQGTAEREPFCRAMLGSLLDLGDGRLRRADPAAGAGAWRQPGRRGRDSVADARPAGRARDAQRAQGRGAVPDPGRRSAAEVSSSGSRRFPDDAGGCPRPASRSPTTRCSRRARSRPFTGLPAVADDSGLAWTRCTACPASFGPLGGQPRRRRGQPGPAARPAARRRRARRRVRLRAALAAPAGRRAAARVDRDRRAGRVADPRAAGGQRLRLRPDLRARGPHR